MKQTMIVCGAFLLAGCYQAEQLKSPIACPDPALVAPASIGGADAVKDLTPRLAGGDWENAVDEAASRFRKQDPSISTDAIVDVIIAADCPNLVAGTMPGGAAERARVATIRQRVMQILGR